MSERQATKSFQAEAELMDTIKRWAKRYATSDSEVIRVALIEGFKALKKDPSPLERQRIDPDEVSPPDIAEQVREAKKPTKK